ncbi:spermidine resistance protein [Ascosphaera acerosa]|nr:spermidine resistance protein [Ascosphaera acerosa]
MVGSESGRHPPAVARADDAANDIAQHGGGGPVPALFVPPSLTINHSATVDLDSSSAFEGPEKLLEVWFAPAPAPAHLPPGTHPRGLKAVPPAVWDGMLDLVSCKVLSIVASADVDAYLLSESSMFVWPHKLILKTCGTTTLLLGIERLMQIAAEYAGFPTVRCGSEQEPRQGRGKGLAAVHRVFYSRKNYLFPDRQRGPHRSWRDEVDTLDRYFANGSAYMIGKMNGEHWYLYVTAPTGLAASLGGGGGGRGGRMMTPPASPPRSICEGSEADSVADSVAAASQASHPQSEQKDETLEILMTDLDPATAQQFYLAHASRVAADRLRDAGAGDVVLPPELTTEGHALGSLVASACGLADIYPAARYPDARIDAYLFTPCGFSANGVVPSAAAAAGGESPGSAGSGTHYFTVHVTPEPHCSYASFETNVPRGQDGRETHDIIAQVVRIFRPGRFTVTFFEASREQEADVAGADGFGYPTPSSSSSVSSAASVVDVEVGSASSDSSSAAPGMAMGASSPRRWTAKTDRIPGYRRTDRIVHDLDGYDLVFRHYEREREGARGVVGGGPQAPIGDADADAAARWDEMVM